MTIGEIIKQKLKEKRRTQRWLAEKISVDEKTLSWKLANESITAKELLEISILLDIDLNEIKEDRVMKQWLATIRHKLTGTIDVETFILAENSDEAMKVLEGYCARDEFDIPFAEDKNGNKVPDESWECRLQYVSDIPVLTLVGNGLTKTYGTKIVEGDSE